MTRLQKIIGLIFPPYNFKVQRQEWTILLNNLVNSLPNDYELLKLQRQKSRLLDLSDWALFPDFKFITIGFPGITLNDFKKLGQNYKLSGLRIFSKKNNNYSNVDFLIHNNYISGIRIENSKYEIEEFDMKRIDSNNIQKISVHFPPSEIELLYEGLDENLKRQLNLEDLFDIEFNNRTYYAFYDMEDGNYLAFDKKMNVYSLVHDARPMSKKLSFTLDSILSDIEAKKFDQEKHLEDRYKNAL